MTTPTSDARAIGFADGPLANRRKVLLAALALPTLSVPSRAASPAFPARPVTLIVPYAAGGSADAMARALATGATRELGQPVVIVNRPGAGLTLGPSLMAKTAPPDGYTISMLSSGLFLRPHLQKVDYDPLKDFSFIMNVVSFAYGIIAMNNARWKTLAELVADAKARPGQISYGSSGYGSASHVAMEQFCKAAGVQFNPVAYKGASETFNALYGGHIDFALEGSLGTSDMSKVRLLASPMDYRITRWPEVPTLKELGYPVAGVGGVGLAGPRGMDPDTVKRLHDAFKSAMGDPAFTHVVDINCLALSYQNSADYAQSAAMLSRNFGVAVADLKMKLE